MLQQRKRSSQGVQVGQQIVDLLIIQERVESRHVPTTQLNGVPHVPIGCGHSTGKFLLAEHAYEWRTLERLVLVRVVTQRTICLEQRSSAPLLRIQRAISGGGVRITAGTNEQYGK
jgi:hypothetical protein